MKDMEKDAIFEMAERYVCSTARSVFLTGKAGTGKTTFLKYITKTTAKRFVVLAPTGVAAVNAGGSTIHSFFQLPLCPYLPDVKELVTEYQMTGKASGLRKERIKIIRTLDLVIIDEISMVRADLMDAVDMMLRRYRRNDKPFGGVQLLMIGDAQQLSPVVRDEDRKYMEQVYPSPYFFHSKALQKLRYVTVEFEKVYRQKDLEFLGILNAVRENRVTRDILKLLNSRVNACPCGTEDTEPIRLTTHNRQADEINSRKLAALPGEECQFAAEVEGDFPETGYPAEQVLTLKKDAQVMFLRNDPDGMFFNGKIGRVESVEPDGRVTVSDSDGNLIPVVPAEWENVKYALDEDTGEIRQSTAGVFRQIPLRVAWAITIHKSQGLTFDRVIIDAGSAFAFGQVYVALSRCRTLEGITLETPVKPSSIYSDAFVAEFNNAIPPSDVLLGNLEKDEKDWHFSLLREIFSFEDIGRSMGWLVKLWRERLTGLYPAECQGLEERDRILGEMKAVGRNFCAQLSRIEAAEVTDTCFLNERLGKAADYFSPRLAGIREYCRNVLSLEIDNKETSGKVWEAGGELLAGLDISCATMRMIAEKGFSPEGYSEIRTSCLLEDRSRAKIKSKKKLVRREGNTGIVNEELRERLTQWRMERFKKDNVPAYTVMHQSTLLEIAALCPKTEEELLAIKGFGKAKFAKYGEEILGICTDSEITGS